MLLSEALEAAREGNFVSHKSFSSNESMHEYKSSLYYEDGANLSINGFIDRLEEEDWAKDGWYIKCPKEKISQEILKKLHDENDGKMLYNKSYEDCIM